MSQEKEEKKKKSELSYRPSEAGGALCLHSVVNNVQGAVRGKERKSASLSPRINISAAGGEQEPASTHCCAADLSHSPQVIYLPPPERSPRPASEGAQ